MKITPADKYFSLCIRERSDWTCEYCGNGYRHKPQGLHCSHLFSRRPTQAQAAPSGSDWAVMGAVSLFFMRR